MVGSDRGGVIFDLDGTLTVPVLDFDAIRGEIGLPPGPILEALPTLNDADRRRALQILDRHEETAARRSELQPQARETVQRLRGLGLPVAVLTRNARRWAQFVLKKHDIAIETLMTRDDGVIKPSPMPVLNLCRSLECNPKKSWMVGDYLFDIQSGREAGCTTVLMLGGRDCPSYAREADHVIAALPDLISLITRGTKA
jgi:HAD superfamily hydrolase (TIGR01509 family)